MRTTKGLFLSVLLAVSTLGIRQPVLAGSQVPTPNAQFDLDPKAKGKELLATITILYKAVEGSTCIGVPPFGIVAESFVMRAEAKEYVKDFWLPFTGTFVGEICLDDFTSQQDQVTAFIEAEVIPAFFCNGQPCSLTATLKSVDRFVDGTGTIDLSGKTPQFAMVDATIVVQSE